MKTIRFMLQAVAVIVTGLLGASLCVLLDLGYWAAPIVAFFVSGAIGAFIVGVFDEDEKSTAKYDTIKHKNGVPYNEAA